MTRTSIHPKRHILKAITYRLLGSSQTCIFTWILTGRFSIGIGVSFLEICIKPAMYFLHERMWYSFSGYGVTQKEEKNDHDKYSNIPD